MKTLRPYQAEATASTFGYFAKSNGNPLIIAPVAAGKSLLMAEFITQACRLYHGTRILVLAHNKELLQQNEAELKEQWPEVETGFYCAGLGKKVKAAPITFASIQSMYRQADKFKGFDLILVDECHLISPDDDSMYQQLFEVMKMKNPYVKIVGYTGTPYRSDTGCLVDSGLFDDIAFEIEIQYLIDEGFLCPPVTPSVQTKMDVTGVGTRAGDYIESQLQKAVNTDALNNGCIDELIELGKDRKCWLIFTAGVEHCLNVRNIIRERGIICEMIIGSTPKAEREDIIQRYKDGEIQCLVNVAVLTTGFNNPRIDLLAFMRPTRSPVLYVQCAGRGMRIYDGKKDCMILDFGGVIDELGPIDKVNSKATGRGKGDGEAPVKQCPKCYSFSYAAVNECEECGHVFESEDGEINIDKKSAKGLAVLSAQIEPEEHKVLWASYEPHHKEGKPTSMKASYGTAKTIFREWVCFEHTGYANRKAEKWHRERSQEPIPKTVEAALAIEYPKPTMIKVRPNGKYFDIINYDFTPEQKEEDPYEIPF